MRYIITNDFNFLIKYNKKYIIAYLFIIMGVLLFQWLMNLEINNEIISVCLGHVFKGIENIIPSLLFIFNLIFYVYISLLVHTKDFKQKVDLIFTRISSNKWLFIKLLSILIITLIFKIIVYLLLIGLGYINGVIITDFILLFLKDILYVITIQTIFINIFNLFHKNKYLGIIYGLILLAVLLYLPIGIINYIKVEEVVKLGTLFIINFLIMIISFKYEYVSIFERNSY